MAAASFDGAGAGALGVHAASRKIGKSAAHQQQRKPVIIYMVSPKIIHVEAHEFMSLVQRLTGPEAAAAAAGHGDKKASSPSPREARRGAGGTPPVRVKARALNRPAGPAVSVSVTATRQQHAPPSSSSAAAVAAGPSPSGFLFHDLSPLRGAALKGEAAAPLVSPGSWLHHVGDHFFSPVGAPAALGSPSAFLDIFGPLPSQHQ